MIKKARDYAEKKFRCNFSGHCRQITRRRRALEELKELIEEEEFFERFLVLDATTGQKQ